MNSRRLSLRLPLATSIAAILAAHATSASAASGNWIFSNAGNASGSWGLSTNWSTDPTIPGSAVDDIIDFSLLDITADSTVTLDGARTVGAIAFGDATTASNNWILNTGTGGPLTLSVASGSPTVHVVNQTATIGAVIAGTQGFTKTGNGILVLNGANTYTGLTTVQSGTLRLGNANALGATSTDPLNGISVLAGATLDLNNQALSPAAGVIEANVTIAGTGVGDLGALVNNGGTGQQNALNKLTLSADASVGGTQRFDLRNNSPVLDLADFTLRKVGANQFSLVGATVTNGNIIVDQGTFSVETSSVIQGTGTMTVNSGGTLMFWTIANPANITRAISSAGGTITSSSTNTGINSPIGLASGTTTLASAGNVTFTLGGAISGPGAISFTGSGAFSLNGANTYAGNTTIDQSRVNIGANSAAFGTGTVSVLGDGIVNDAQVYAAGATLANNFQISGFGGNAVDGTQRGALRLDSGSVINGTVSLTGNAAIGSNTGTGTINGVISGNFNLTKVDAGTIVLAADNTYTGSTTISGGTLTLDYSANDANRLSDTGALILGSGTLNLAGNTTGDPTESVASTTLNTGAVASITRTSGAAQISLGTITRNAPATLNVGADNLAKTTSGTAGEHFGSWFTVGGGSLATKDGSDNIISVAYNDVPTITGTINDSAGHVRITNASAGNVVLGSGTTINATSLTRNVANLATIDTTGKTLRLAQTGSILSAGASGGITIGTSANAGSLTAGGTDNAAGVLDINAAVSNVTINSAITDNGSGIVSLSRIGGGELRLSGTNTYSGGTTLSGGVTRLNSNSAFGTGPVSVIGNTQIAGLSGGQAATSVANTIAVNSGVTLDFATGSTALTINGAISGGGNLAKSSGGTAALTAANTYTGTTTINAGTLQIAGAGTLGNGTYSNTISVASGTILDVATSANQTLSGVVSGAGVVKKSSTGVLTLSATNTYAGGTTISQGTVSITNLAGAGTGTITLGDANTGNSNVALLWTPSATAQTVANAITVANQGTGTVTIGTNNNTQTNQTFSGALTLNRATILSSGTNDRLSYTGVISGNVGTLTFAATNAGRVTLTGGAANTFVGDVVVNSGATLQLGTITAAQNYIPNASSMTVNGTFNLSYSAGGTETINALNGSGTVGINAGVTNTLILGSANGSGTFSGVISGAANMALTKQGNGTQILTGANTYTGATTVSAGTLQVGNLGTTGSLTSAVAIASGATLAYSRSDSPAIANNLSGAGAVVYHGNNNGTAIGTSSFNLGGTNTMTGTMTANNARLQIDAAADIGSATLLNTNSGQIWFSNANTYTNNLTIQGIGWGETSGNLGAIRMTANSTGGTVLSGAITLAGDARIATHNGTASDFATINGNIGESGGARTLEIGGSSARSIISLGGTNTYTGGTIINGSIRGLPLGTGSVLTLNYGTNDTSKLSGDITNGVLTFKGTSTLTLAGATGSHIETVGSTTVNGAGTINRSGANTATVSLGAITNNGVLNVASAGLATTSTGNNPSNYLSGVTFGGTSLAANDGSGNIVAFNSHVDVTRLSSGTKTISSAVNSVVRIIEGTGTAGNVTMTLGGTTDIGSLFQTSTAAAATVDIGANNTLRLGASGEIISGAGSSAVTIQAGTLTAGGADDTLGTISIVNGGSNAITIASPIANNGSAAVAVRVGAGSVTLSGTNTYSGGTTLSGGTLTLGNLAGLGTGSLTVNSDAALASTVAGNIANNIAINSGVIANINLGGAGRRLTGIISGAGALAVSGTSELLGSNTYSGGTTVTGGVLGINGDAALGAIPGAFSSSNIVLTGGTLSNSTNGAGADVTLNANRGITIGAGNGTIEAAGSSTLTVNGIIGGAGGAGTLTKTGTGTLVLNAINTYTAATTINATSGTLRISGNGQLASGTYGGALAIGASSTFDYNSSATQTMSGVISGAGALTKSGPGTLTISGNNTYTGLTTVSGGLLRTSGTLSLGGTSAVNVSAGGTLETNATNIFVGGHGTALADTKIVTLDSATWTMTSAHDARVGNVTLSNGSTWTSNRGLAAFDALLANVTSGAATVAVTGTGASQMNGTGGLHLQGVQNFNVSDTTGSAAADLTVSMVLANPGSIGGANGGVNKLGAGTMLLTATNSYLGATTVSAGTLLVNGSISGSSLTTVSGTGTLGGSGTVGALTLDAGGTLAPGNSPGILNAGNTAFNGGTFALELSGITAGTGYDQLNVTGTVGFTANTPLTINLGVYNPADNVDSFTIVNNDANDGVSLGGFLFTFGGNPLAEGAVFTAGIQDFQISYAGGVNNNDIVLTAVPEPTSAMSLMGGLAVLVGARRRRKS